MLVLINLVHPVGAPEGRVAPGGRALITCQNLEGDVTVTPLKTRPFQIPRLRLAYLAGEEYLRTLWWIAATVPTFGIVMLIFGDRLMQVIGMMAILWPISIPARGIVSSGKAGSLFTRGCFAELDDQYLTFYDTSNRPRPLRWRVSLEEVRDVVERRDFLVVRMRRMGFVAIPLSAFQSEDDRAEFVRTGNGERGTGDGGR
jgi:hypothetical protein